ncbi:MAG: putative glycolate oxidase [Firmicutes bacterium]|nr:putative glycolate oxidase [Bacillota bacterium]
MANYKKVTTEVVAMLQKIVGAKNISVDLGKLSIYSHDEVTDPHYHHMPEVVVFPETTEQIADIIKLANQEMIPVVPRGAGTGLACGAVPQLGGIVLSVEKLNKIIEVNADEMYMIVQAGVMTQDVQQAAGQVGLLYAGDPSSGDSCFIGGNVATNAGGLKAVKYGTTRHQVYSMVIVTPKGDITTVGGRLKKNTTGYALEQLIIGSEGTLGIITEITLKLVPQINLFMDFLAVYPDTKSAIDTVSKLIKAGVNPTCLEFMDNAMIKSVEKYIKEKLPYAETCDYLIVQVERDTEDELDEVAAVIDDICTENGAVTVLVPDPGLIWEARKASAEAVRAENLIHSNDDMVVPIEKQPIVAAEMIRVSKKYKAAARMVSHAGDGNMHLSLLPGDIPEAEWEATVKRIQHEILDVIVPLGAKISGEHGIGLKKKPLMEYYTDPVELEMMRAIKKALDPNLILNPGKIFDVE